MNQNDQPTNQDILDAMSEFAGKVEIRFDKLEVKTTKIEATMVTKEYLDEKLADLRGDLVVLMRKEDTKLKTLIGILRQKQIISENDEKQILTMEPFAQIA